MKELEVLLLVAIAAMGILLIILLQKITILKKQADEIVKEVKAYVAYVTDTTEEEIANSRDSMGGQASSTREKNSKPMSREEAQNRIIQAVLGEYFP